jgi:hypothetical protein
MDTSKVIELGAVSEETKGSRLMLENHIDPTTGPEEGG